MVSDVQLDADEALCDAATEEHDCAKHSRSEACTFHEDVADTHLAMANRLPEYIAEVRELRAEVERHKATVASMTKQMLWREARITALEAALRSVHEKATYALKRDDSLTEQELELECIVEVSSKAIADGQASKQTP